MQGGCYKTGWSINTTRISFINLFLPRCSSNCIQQPKDEAEFKDAALYPGLGNIPLCISKKCLFFFPPRACLALPLKRRLACEHLKIFHKHFFSLQFCFGPSTLPLPPRTMGAQGLHKDRCRTQGVCQHLESTFCYLFSLAFFHTFLVGR